MRLQSIGPFATLSTAAKEQFAVWFIEEMPREMERFNGLEMGLGTLSRLSAAQTRSISAENPTGEPGRGGMAIEGTGAIPARELGQGWKVSPSIEIAGGETVTLADIEGPGAIQHIWLTVHPRHWRSLVWRVYANIILPLSRPILAALAVFFFLANWNSFLWPLTITNDPNLWVVQTGIASFQQQYASAQNYIMAASVVVAMPTMLIFFIFPRQLVESIKTSGFK
jgi:hypothetical protein